MGLNIEKPSNMSYEVLIEKMLGDCGVCGGGMM